MANRWDFRAVEGVLYGLGKAVERQPGTAQQSRPPEARVQAETLAPSQPFGSTSRISHSLSPDEVQDIRDHYILGVKRHGYKRRAHIIKKIVATLNDESGEPQA